MYVGGTRLERGSLLFWGVSGMREARCRLSMYVVTGWAGWLRLAEVPKASRYFGGAGVLDGVLLGCTGGSAGELLWSLFLLWLGSFGTTRGIR